MPHSCNPIAIVRKRLSSSRSGGLVSCLPVASSHAICLLWFGDENMRKWTVESESKPCPPVATSSSAVLRPVQNTAPSPRPLRESGPFRGSGQLPELVGRRAGAFSSGAHAAALYLPVALQPAIGCRSGAPFFPLFVPGPLFSVNPNVGRGWSCRCPSPHAVEHRNLGTVSGMDPVESDACVQASRAPEPSGKRARQDSRSSSEDGWESSGSPGRPPSRTVAELEAIAARLRSWDLTKLGREQLRAPPKKNGQEFTVLSYNVLAQCLLEDNYYLYQHCDPDILQWNFRKGRILKELQSSDADVLCLQEVQSEHYDDFFLPLLTALGYQGLFKKRTGDKNDGCAIFYKTSSFDLKSSIGVEYCKPGIAVLDRDNIALVVMLVPKTGASRPEHPICVANTHLLFNPGRGDIKLAQLRVLLAEIDKFAFRRMSRSGKPLYQPVILCGDLNSEPHCDLYKFIGTGALHYEGLIAGDISGQAGGFYRGRFFLNRELVPQTLGISDQCQYAETWTQRTGYRAERHCVLDAADGSTGAKDRGVGVTGGSTGANDGSIGGATNCGVDATDGDGRAVPIQNGSRAPPEARSGTAEVPPVCDAAVDGVRSHGDSPRHRSKYEPRFSSGMMTHRLNLVSAYGHTLDRLGGELAVTTHHAKGSCTVDYIFYSVHRKESRLRHGKVVHGDVREGELALLGTYGLLSDRELSDLGGLPNGALPSDHLPLVAKFLLMDS